MCVSVCVGTSVCTDVNAEAQGSPGPERTMITHDGDSQGLGLTTNGLWQGRMLAEAHSFLSGAFIWLCGTRLPPQGDLLLPTLGWLAHAALPQGALRPELLPLLGTILLSLPLDGGLWTGIRVKFCLVWLSFSCERL